MVNWRNKAQKLPKAPAHIRLFGLAADQRWSRSRDVLPSGAGQKNSFSHSGGWRTAAGEGDNNSSVCRDPHLRLASPPCTANSSGRARHKNCSPLNVEAIRDSIRAAEHSGNRTPSTCAQEYPEGPKAAELMRENICAPQVCTLESTSGSTGTQHP